MQEVLETLYHQEGRRIFASLVGLLRDFDLAEEALQEAFAAAAERWPTQGLPKNPRAWLVSAGRFKAIDGLRRKSRNQQLLQRMASDEEGLDQSLELWEESRFEDDQLKLIFTCCHPSLGPDVQVALTLREVCGLTTEEIASAFLTSTSTMAQRLVRGKAKIRDAAIAIQAPPVHRLRERLESVQAVLYLIFNEGYSASSGNRITRADLCQEALWLARLLVRLCPDGESHGLLALMLLQDARRPARLSPQGDLIRLADQDRSLWNREAIEEGLQQLETALQHPEVGPYTLQAAIAAEHGRALRVEDVNWPGIVQWYSLLQQAQPSPVVELNALVARSMCQPLEPVQAELERLVAGPLADYHLAHAALADVLRRRGQPDGAAAAYRTALERTRQKPEQRFLKQCIEELSKAEVVPRL